MPSRLKCVLSCLLLSTCLLPSVPVAAQDSAAVPRAEYFLAFGGYFEGEFRSSANNFRSAARGGVRSGLGRWVDSVCYHTMMGECFYRMGEPALALEQYDAAATLYLAHQDWLLRVQFPPTVQASQRVVTKPPTWGTPQRRFVLSNIPDKMLSMQGTADVQQVLQQGGVLAPQQLFPLHVAEIVRCTALAMRRRAEIMGPAGEHSPLTAQLVAALSRRQTMPNHWSQAWIDGQLGMAYLAQNKPAQAAAALQSSLLVGNQFDHVLTPMALLELGKIAFSQGDFRAAANSFLEASYSAAAQTQYDVVEEALRWGAMTHLVAGGQGLYPPLGPAVAWADRTSKHLQVSLKLAAAENLAALNQTSPAAATLADARRLLNRSEMMLGEIGGRLQFVAATVAFQAGDVPDGSASLAAALKYHHKSSLRLFHLGLVDGLYTNGAVTPRVADDLYQIVLREPTVADWTQQPADTLAYVTSSHLAPLERWFDIAVARKDHERALELAEQIRRHRFHLMMPLGGRLLALRWILEAPTSALSQVAALQRQDLLNLFPRYAELSRQAEAVRDSLRQLPIAPADEAELRRQREELDKLAAISMALEVVLNEMAVRRVPSELAFPPLRTFAEMQQAIPEGQMLLALLATSKQVHAFALTREKYQLWQIENPGRIRTNLAALLKQSGVVGRDATTPIETLASNDWRESADDLAAQLTAGMKFDDWDTIEEVVVVPDRLLWYVPFDALPIGPAANAKATFEPLIAKRRVRYAPTVALASSDGRGPTPRDRTAIVSGAASGSRDTEAAQRAAARIAESLPAAELLPELPASPSAIQAATFDRLVVMRDSVEAARSPLEWHPAVVDQTSPAGTLAAWLRSPWQGPEQVLLPAFHTSAEAGMKANATGDEVFMAACGLMASGARTVLLSRWNTGGRSQQDLVREFAQELPFAPADQAWQRAVHLLWATGIDVPSEPRVRVGTGAEAEAALARGLSAEQPLFWAGYLVIDNGWRPADDAAQVQAVENAVPEDADPVEPAK